MENKLKKIGMDLDKARAKRDQWVAKVKTLEAKYREEENTQIHELVHAAHMSPEELAELIRKARITMPMTQTEVNEEENEDEE